jgi:hypothetical protein
MSRQLLSTAGGAIEPMRGYYINRSCKRAAGYADGLSTRNINGRRREFLLQDFLYLSAEVPKNVE